jgi:hypothetical protein
LKIKRDYSGEEAANFAKPYQNRETNDKANTMKNNTKNNVHGRNRYGNVTKENDMSNKNINKSANGNNNKKYCKLCDKDNHYTKDCYSIRVCHRCGEEGHIASKCGNIDNNHNDDDNADYVGCALSGWEYSA